MRWARWDLADILILCGCLYSQDFDLLISNGSVVDGSGKPAFRADVGVRQDRIAAIGKLQGSRARRQIDASDLTVMGREMRQSAWILSCLWLAGGCAENHLLPVHELSGPPQSWRGHSSRRLWWAEAQGSRRVSTRQTDCLRHIGGSCNFPDIGVDGGIERIQQVAPAMRTSSQRNELIEFSRKARERYQ